ncbi:hypothetical protein WAI453_003038 [Rhynchosporium graminicola]|uniref:Related to toxD protein n=1 Tax=Rhynchosporium graminicola TaxID=2792576 RepID=A0A1E1LT37_9HELO|nr:related to toxD gene [Rhynchosporium commune]
MNDSAAVSREMFALPSTQRAVVVKADGQVTVQDDYPVRALEPDEFCVKTEALAVNPSDLKLTQADFSLPSGVLGGDYAGTVIAVGSDVKGIELGDRVCGGQNPMHAKMPDMGAFKEYNVNNGRIWLKLPSWIDTEAGASMGVSVGTAGHAIIAAGLPLPDVPAEKPFTVLVWGGATSTGTIAIQLLKLANLTPIATCSPKNFDLVESYGAAEVFDYKDPEVAGKIRTYTGNRLAYALDCVSTVPTTKACYAAIGRAGGKYVALNAYPEHTASRKLVSGDWVLAPTLSGHGSTWPAPYGRPASEELRKAGFHFYEVAQKLLDEGKLRPHPIRVLDGGLEAVAEGLELVKSGTLSAQKVVIRMHHV